MRAHRFAILSALGTAVLLVGPGTPAHAQARVPGWGAVVDVRAQVVDARAQAYDNGYNRGYHEGTEEARAGRQADVRRLNEYRDADWGYQSHFGSRDAYRSIFREGFEVGYHDAFEGRENRQVLQPTSVRQERREYGYGAWGADRERGPSQIAFNYGYNDGFERGTRAARRHQAFDPDDEGWYRSADRHYDHEYGSRDRYRAAYRDGFLRGYERGYRNLDRDDIR